MVKVLIRFHDTLTSTFSTPACPSSFYRPHSVWPPKLLFTPIQQWRNLSITTRYHNQLDKMKINCHQSKPPPSLHSFCNASGELSQVPLLDPTRHTAGDLFQTFHFRRGVCKYRRTPGGREKCAFRTMWKYASEKSKEGPLRLVGNTKRKRKLLRVTRKWKVLSERFIPRDSGPMRESSQEQKRESAT